MIKHNEDGNMVLSALVVDEEFCVIDYKSYSDFHTKSSSDKVISIHHKEPKNILRFKVRKISAGTIDCLNMEDGTKIRLNRHGFIVNAFSPDSPRIKRTIPIVRLNKKREEIFKKFSGKMVNALLQREN